MNRKSGVLLHLSSLPSKYGIGSLGKAAYEFVDSLYEAGQSCWQILPSVPFSLFRNSNNPYQGLSAFANNPYFIDIDFLIEDGLLETADVADTEFFYDEQTVDFGLQFQNKPPLFKKAYENGINRYRRDYLEYCEQNECWLFDYALFVVLQRTFGHKPFSQWDCALANREEEAILQFSDAHESEIEQERFIQFLYEQQWRKLKAYATERGIEIIGDIPIYVAPGGVEEWAHPEIFQNNGLMGGAPPDSFAQEGQCWETHVYDWEYLKRTGYRWWVQRMERSLTLFDWVRLDHFRGFEAYFAIPEGKKPAEGHWEKGPGIELFRTMEKELGPLRVIAEDLGFLTPEVFRMLEQTGFMGTKVLQFGFDEPDSIYLPHNYHAHCVVYTGTHDNNTILGWYQELHDMNRQLVRDYIGVYADENIADAMIRLAMGSVARICILPMQDILNLGEEARMNYPSTILGNWEWRMEKGSFSKKYVDDLRIKTETFGRLNNKLKAQKEYENEN